MGRILRTDRATLRFGSTPAFLEKRADAKTPRSSSTPGRFVAYGPGGESPPVGAASEAGRAYIMPGMPPPGIPPGMPPPPPLSFSGFSATVASVVSSRAATLAAFWRA